MRNWLYRREIPINGHIRVVVPTVGEILDREEAYYSMVSILTAMPIDMMVQLDDAGIDFTSLNEYDLFLMLFDLLAEQDTRLVFGDLDLTRFEMTVNRENGTAILLDAGNGIIIDRAIHGQIADTLRKIHHLEKNVRRPANEAAKKYMLERARIKIKRREKQPLTSELENLIVSAVNTEQFKYDFSGVRGLSIYQFNESVRQIIRKTDYDNRMHGVYAGTVDVKSLSQDDMNWLAHS